MIYKNQKLQVNKIDPNEDNIKLIVIKKIMLDIMSIFIMYADL